MQYNTEVYTYQRTNRVNKENSNEKLFNKALIMKLMIYFWCPFLISRVIMINSTAPFGIALLIAILLKAEGKSKLIALMGTVLGYVSLYNHMKTLPMYIIAAITITIVNYIMDKLSQKKLLLIFLLFIIGEFGIYKLLVQQLTVDVAIFTSFLETVCIFPLYYILSYSITCFKNIRTKHLFSSEEIISMAITISLVISGTWGISIYNISLRNLLALSFILVISYINGSIIGAASGVAAGVIVGMYSNDMLIYISVFGLCGLVSGIFKETGKWMTGAAFAITFLILNLYSKKLGDVKLAEAIISSGVFMIIPNKIYHRLSLEISYESKKENITDNYIDRIKNIFIKRLDSFSDVLFSMSDILNNLVNNDKLALKTKSSALVENLADRVCSSCNMKSMCWKRELYYTYAAFEELISNFQDNRNVIPKEIERKCIKRTLLLKNTEEIVNNYIISEMWRMRLSEGRETLASQINSMANTVKEILCEFNGSLRFNDEIEANIRNILYKSNIDFNDVMCINDKKDRLVVKMSMKACGGRQICVKSVLPLINEASERCMCVSDEGCIIDPDTNLCSVEFEETPRYHISSYVRRMSKNGEKDNGDSYSFGKLNDGTYMIIISDGMGSGPEAGRESKAAIDLIEKFTASGLSKITAINTVNSIMTLKFSEDEKFSTVDLCSVDLYSGEAQFMKVGAVASFIKRNDRVEVINSKTLPIGVLDKVDIETTEKRIQNGDIIVMISDGILDYDNDNVGKTEWVIEYLKNSNSNNPKELVDGLVKKSIELGGHKAKDDMTAIVSKVYSLY